MMAVLVSPSFHSLELPRLEYERLLAELYATVLDSRLPDIRRSSRTTTSHFRLAPASRREALLAQATRMFARSGFENVSTEDVASAVGIAGPSVYNHFATKTELLAAAFRRTAETLFTGVSGAYALRLGPAETLLAVLRSYIEFSLAHHDSIGLLVTEVRQLPDDDRHEARRAQHDYLGEWSHLLHLAKPELGPLEARLRVQVVIDLVNNAARIPPLRRNRDVPAALEAMSAQLLALPV
jgi:AcrR family transcriptional regulator